MKARSAVGALLLTSLALTFVHASELTPAEARAIAKEAYVYGFPMVHSYRIQHAYFVDVRSPEYKAPWNRLRNIARVYTPDDKAVQTPNSDTPYSLPHRRGRSCWCCASTGLRRRRSMAGGRHRPCSEWNNESDGVPAP